MRTLLILIFSVLTITVQSQELQNRSIAYYFDQIAELEMKELIKHGVFIDSVTVADEYLDKKTGKLNDKGISILYEIERNIYESFFKDYLYQQHIVHDNAVYVLYFTVAGFDDIEWIIVKWNKKDWSNEGKLSRKKLKSDSSLSKLFWNYDEGPKNIENIRLFIQNDYLVFERGNLYHSLYDLKSHALIFNEATPWQSSGAETKEKMNEWIKTNLHDKIEKKIKEIRK